MFNITPQKQLILVVVLLFLMPYSYGQIIKINPEDGVLADELGEKFPEDDYLSLGTHATYSFPYSTINDDLNAELTYEETILSLKENKSFIKYDFEDDKSFVSNLSAKNHKGKTYPTYGALQKAKYKSAGIFHDDISTVSIAFGLATRGSKIKYTYDKTYYDVKYLTKAFFHTSYRSQETKISFVIPPWLDIEFKEINFDGYNIEKSESTQTVRRVENKVITYTLKDVKGVKNELFSAGYTTSLPHIIILPKKYTYKEETVRLFSSTDDLYNWYNSLVKDVNNSNSEYNGILESLTKDAKSDIEKIENIFYWVQDNIRYIAFEDGIMGFKPASDKDVFTKKYGDCKGMANLTCEMLKSAGYDARLTWIGTRKIPYTYDIPSLAVDNHMITTLILDGKRYFLDATEKGVSFGDYAHRIQGQDVLIQDGDNYIIDTVPEFESDHNMEVLQLNLELLEDKLKGNGKQEFKGEEKIRLFRSIKYVSKVDQEKAIENYLANNSKNFSISNINSSDFNNRNEDIKFEYDIEIFNQIVSAGKEQYITLEKDFDFEKLMIEKEEERVTDMNLGSKYHIVKTTDLTVPVGMKIDYLPEPISYDNEEYKIDASYSANGNVITYKKLIVIKTGIISLKNIPEWNKSIKQLRKFYKDQIVLIKP